MANPRHAPTRHFRERTDERRLDADVLQFILVHGEEYEAAGTTHLTVRERELPLDVIHSQLARQSRDWIVVVAPNGTLLTCYRRRGAVRFLRQKIERRHCSRRSRDLQAEPAEASDVR